MHPIGIYLGRTKLLFAEARQDISSDCLEGHIRPIRQGIYSAGQTRPVEQSCMPAIAFFPQTGADAGNVCVGIEAETRTALLRDTTRCAVTNVRDHMGRSQVLPAPISRSPAEITALFLKHVLANACSRSYQIDGDALTLTVPIGFTQAQRSDTLLALRLAINDLGLRLPDSARPERTLISEPVAALLDFIAADLKRDELHRRIEYVRGPSVLVYDMGSATLNLTLIRLMQIDRRLPVTLRNLRFDIIAASPDNPVGAADFNQCVAKALDNVPAGSGNLN